MENNIYIFGVIGRDVKSSDIARQISLIQGDSINVFIDSPGGVVDEGFAIHDALIASGKTIHCLVQGQCKSIATAPLVAAKLENRKGTPYSSYMVHNPWMKPAASDADMLESSVKKLRDKETQLAEFYTRKLGIESGAIQSMMKATTDMTPTQAVQAGLISEILEPVMACAYLPEEEINSNNENIFMKSINEKLSAIKDLVKGKLSAKSEDINNWELALEDGRTLVGISPQDVNAASIGDNVKLKDGQGIEDGEYAFAESKDRVIVKGNKIDDILRFDLEATEEISNLSKVIDTVETLAVSNNDKFESINAQVKEAFEKVDAINALLTEKATKIDELTAANESLKAELNEVKSSITSDYTPPSSHEVQASAKKALPEDATQIELEKIKNKNRK